MAFEIRTTIQGTMGEEVYSTTQFSNKLKGIGPNLSFLPFKILFFGLCYGFDLFIHEKTVIDVLFPFQSIETELKNLVKIKKQQPLIRKTYFC